jgi:receptor-type tyrosine-protein phosphatase Q
MTNQDIPSGPPMSLIGSNSSSTSLFISWMIPLLDDQNGVILGYNITYFALTNTTVVFTDSTSDLNINITSLMIYTVYNVSVAAYTSVGTGPSTSIEIRTDSSVPTAPLNVVYRNISSTSVEVSWDEPTTFNGPNEGYEVRYTREETNITMTIHDIMSTSVNISDLEIYEVYTITVLALSDKGVGESSQITILTDEDCKLLKYFVSNLLYYSTRNCV